MKPSEAADLYGVNKKTIYRLVKNGQIKGAKVLPTGTIVIPGNYKEEKEKLNMLSLVNRYENMLNVMDRLERLFDDDWFYSPRKGLKSLDWDEEEKKIKRFEEGKCCGKKDCQCLQKDGQTKLAFKVPGVDKKDIKVQYHKGYITVETEKSKESKDESSLYSYSYSEYVGDVRDIASSLKNGILTVSYKKNEKKLDAPKQIAIE